MQWRDLILPEDCFDQEQVLNDWHFLLQRRDLDIMLVTSFGDIFFQDHDDAVYLLDATEGTFDKVLKHATDFEESLKNLDLVKEWFMPDIVKSLIELIPLRGAKSCFSMKVLPPDDGQYEVSNYQIALFSEHSRRCATYFSTKR